MYLTLERKNSLFFLAGQMPLQSDDEYFTYNNTKLNTTI